MQNARSLSWAQLRPSAQRSETLSGGEPRCFCQGSDVPGVLKEPALEPLWEAGQSLETTEKSSAGHKEAMADAGLY